MTASVNKLPFEAMILAVRRGMTAIADLGSDATKVVHNGALGPSTLADKASEAAILDVLRSKCPGIPVVAEEAFSHGFVPTTGDFFFLVDPLDGTKDFLARREGYTVNVALIERTAPVAGVIGAPHSRTLYVGGVGFGAYRENDTVRTELIGRRFRRDAMVAVTSLSHPNSETADFLKRLGNTSSIEIGSSLKFCLLAEGAADLYPRYGRTMEWDIAAGDAILRAAGGMTLALNGEPMIYGKRSQANDSDFANPHFLAVGDASCLSDDDIRL